MLIRGKANIHNPALSPAFSVFTPPGIRSPAAELGFGLLSINSQEEQSREIQRSPEGEKKNEEADFGAMKRSREVVPQYPRRDSGSKQKLKDTCCSNHQEVGHFDRCPEHFYEDHFGIDYADFQSKITSVLRKYCRKCLCKWWEVNENCFWSCVGADPIHYARCSADNNSIYVESTR